MTLEGSMKPPRFIERGGNKGGDQTERKKARRLEGRAERRGGELEGKRGMIGRMNRERGSIYS